MRDEIEPSEILCRREDPPHDPVKSVSDFDADVTRDDEEVFPRGECEKYPSSSSDEERGDEKSDEGDAGRGEVKGDKLSVLRGRGVKAA